MNEALESEFWNIICFIVVSAANLDVEKKEYGPLRLLEVATRLIRVLRSQGLKSERLDTIQKRIDENKHLIMTDESHFKQFLQSLALEIVDFMNN